MKYSDRDFPSRFWAAKKGTTDTQEVMMRCHDWTTGASLLMWAAGPRPLSVILLAAEVLLGLVVLCQSPAEPAAPVRANRSRLGRPARAVA